MSIKVRSPRVTVTRTPQSVRVEVGGRQGLAGPPGTLAGSAFGFGIPRPTVVDGTLTPFSYVPFAFRLTALKSAGLATGDVTIDLLKNGLSVGSFDLNSVDIVDFDFGDPVTFAVGDVLSLLFSGSSGSPTGLQGTFVGVRL